MDVLNLIISLVSGVIGGNAAGAALKEKSLGTLGNSITGLLGGGAGGYIVQLLGILSAAGVTGATGAVPGVEGLDIGQFLANVGASGVGGAILTAIIGYLKNAAAQK